MCLRRRWVELLRYNNGFSGEMLVNLHLNLVTTNIQNDFGQYFRRVEAQVANLGKTPIGLREAWLLCEYLDAADSADAPCNSAVYAYAREALADFLVGHENRRNLESLCARSWAASTLMSIIDKARTIRAVASSVCNVEAAQEDAITCHLKLVA